MSDSGRILTNNSFTCPPPPFADQPKHFFLIKLSPIGRLCLPAQAPHGIPSPPPAVGHVHTPPPPGTSLGLRPQVVYDSHATTPAILEKTARLTLLDAEGTRPFQRFSCGWCLGSRPPPPRGGGPGTCDPPNIKPPWLCMWGFNTLRGGC